MFWPGGKKYKTACVCVAQRLRAHNFLIKTFRSSEILDLPRCNLGGKSIALWPKIFSARINIRTQTQNSLAESEIYNMFPMRLI
jgi:hypothetical protein